MASHPGCRQRNGTNYVDFVWARPVERKLGLEYPGVCVSLHALADGRR